MLYLASFRTASQPRKGRVSQLAYPLQPSPSPSPSGEGETTGEQGQRKFAHFRPSLRGGGGGGCGPKQPTRPISPLDPALRVDCRTAQNSPSAVHCGSKPPITAHFRPSLRGAASVRCLRGAGTCSVLQRQRMESWGVGVRGRWHTAPLVHQRCPYIHPALTQRRAARFLPPQERRREARE